MHVRTRSKLSKRAKMWPTTYPVRLGSPALRDLDRIPPPYAGTDPVGTDQREAPDGVLLHRPPGGGVNEAGGLVSSRSQAWCHARIIADTSHRFLVWTGTA
jgi:hypothetical protein